MIEDSGVFLAPTQYTMLDDARRVDDDDFWRNQPTHKRAKHKRYAAQLLDCAEGVASSSIMGPTPECSRMRTTGGNSL